MKMVTDSKKAYTLHVVIGYLKETINSDYKSKCEKKIAKDLLNIIEEELKAH